MNAVNRRDWCVARGLAKPGRGRMSAAAWDAMDEAARNGTIFVDSKAVTAEVVVTDAETGEKVVEVRELNPFAPHMPSMRLDSHYTFTFGNKSLRVSVTEACHGCRFSMGWCRCPGARSSFLNWKDQEVYTIA